MTPARPENPFLKLSFFEFLAVQTLTLLFFPVSLLICALAFGPTVTRQLIEALVRDWLQTMLILTVLVLSLGAALIWGLWSWL